jgi:hypothetical protein
MAAARCPMCHQANDASAWNCERCGYEFGQSIETLRGMLEAQLQRSIALLAILLIVDLAIVAGVIYLMLWHDRVVMPGLVFVLAVIWTVRVAGKIGVSRHSLKLINAKQVALPKATLRSK